MTTALLESAAGETKVYGPGPLALESDGLPAVPQGPHSTVDTGLSVLQIRRGNRDNLGIVFHTSAQKHTQ